VGYVGLPEEAYQLARQRFQDRRTGTIFGAEGADVTGTRVEEMLRSAEEGSASSDTTSEE